jgi:hypothetical protein
VGLCNGPSTFARAISVTYPAPWGTTSRIPGQRRCDSSKFSGAATSLMCRSTSGWLLPELVDEHLKLDRQVTEALGKNKVPVVIGA